LEQTKDDFFSNLRDVCSRHGYLPHNIYNTEETVITTLQKLVRVAAAKGSKQASRTTSAERGTLVTACCCVNAFGNAIPPFFVYPHVHFKSNMIVEGLRSTWLYCDSESVRLDVSRLLFTVDGILCQASTVLSH